MLEGVDQSEGVTNLWDWTLKHPAVHGDAEKGLSILATFFQNYRDQSFVGVIEDPKLRSAVEKTYQLIQEKSGSHHLQYFPAGTSLKIEACITFTLSLISVIE